MNRFVSRVPPLLRLLKRPGICRRLKTPGRHRRSPHGSPVQALAIDIDKIEVERKAFFSFEITRKEDFFARGMENRSQLGLPKKKAELPKVAAIGIADEQFHFGRLYQALRQEVFVFLDGRLGRLGGPEDDCVPSGEKRRRRRTRVRR